MGLLDGLLDGGNGDAAMAQQFGVTPDMIAQQRGGALGQIGAALLAAAQPGPMGQRAQALSQLGSVSGDFNKGLLTAAQARLMGASANAAQAKTQGLKDAMASIDPNTLNPVERAAYLADPAAFIAKRQGNADQLALYKQQREIDAANRDDPALKQKIDALKAAGVPEDIATKLATGAAQAQQVEVPDMSVPGGKRTEFRVFDLTTGKQLAMPAAAAPAPALGTGANPATSEAQVQQLERANGSVGADGAATNAPLLNPAQSLIAKPLDRSTYPKDLAFSEATGGAGGFKQAWNTLAGNVWGGKGFEGQTKAANFLNQLDTETKNVMQEEVPGRVTNMVRADLEEKHAIPLGSRGMPDPQALEALKGRRDYVQRALGDLTEKLKSPGMYDAKSYRQMQDNAAKLNRIVDMHNYVVDNFWGQGATGGGVTPNGIPFRIKGQN